MAVDVELWTIVHAFFGAVAAFVIFVIFLVGLGLARQRKDPARVAFLWLKLVFAFEIMYVSS